VSRTVRLELVEFLLLGLSQNFSDLAFDLVIDGANLRKRVLQDDIELRTILFEYLFCLFLLLSREIQFPEGQGARGFWW